MIENAKWIWLDPAVYPDCQTSAISVFDGVNMNRKFSVAEFLKTAEFKKTVKTARIEVSGDVRFFLYVNNKFIGLGPVCPGGDYGAKKPMKYTYYNTFETEVNSEKLAISAFVQTLPSVMCDMSSGHCGFILSCELTFEDGTVETIVTDETWQSRIDNRRYALYKADYTIKCDAWRNAVCTDWKWELKKSPLKNLHTEEVFPTDFEKIELLPGESREIKLEFDKIYSAYYNVEVSQGDSYTILIRDYERYPEKAIKVSEMITGSGPLKYRGLDMKSVGGVVMNVHNTGMKPVTIEKLSLIFTHYPVTDVSDFECSEPVFNKIYNIGKWALKICKQTIELDSPKHQENLGCAGDYHISSLMNYFTYGDTELTRFDLVRIAHFLEMADGYMFHTTYSMIWIMMIKEYYKFTADMTVFDETKKALTMLLEKVNTYVGEKGIVDNPPTYMFVDWLVVDGYSIHHPPMALGQGVLNAFYYGGLLTAAELFELMGDGEYAAKCLARAASIKDAFNKWLYDEDKKLYCDGLNDEYEYDPWRPKNPEKRYFSWHTNTLAALFGIADEKRSVEIMETVLNDYDLMNPQPYFMHFTLEAIHKTGLFEKYGLQQLKRWEIMTDFEKGLMEGWYDYTGTYGFDYSHVWGGTPTYQLPSKIMGFEMVEAGFKKIRLNPNLYGLEYANIKMPTPYGAISVNLRKGEEPVISVPEQIELVR